MHIQTQVLVVGHTCVDVVHHVPHTPGLNDKALAHDMTLELGGCAARVAHHVHDSCDTHLISVLGRSSHMFTQFAESHLAHIPHTLHHVDTPACVSMIWCDAQGNRTISSYQPPEILTAVLHTPVTCDAQVAMFDNYRWNLVQQVRSHLNPECVQILDVDHACTPDHMSQFQGFDQIWFSESVWRSWNMSLNTVAQACGACVVGFTQGAAPVVWSHAGHIHTHVPPQVRNVNTTLGAGDAWRAGLAKSLVKNLDVIQAVKAACASAVNHMCA